MDTFQLIVLAIIQGLTEFLPISSSGHLLLPKEVLGWPDQGLTFDIAVHLGSLIAVVGYFYRDLIQLAQRWFLSFRGNHSSDSNLVWMVGFATIPAGLCGLLLGDFIEAHLRSVNVIIITTVVFGLALGAADYLGVKKKQLVDITLASALLIGVAQAVALMPGTSRSGITITMALILGFTRQDAARFSFLLSIPIIVLSAGYESLKLLDSESFDLSSLAIGLVFSAISAALCIHWFLKLIDRIGMLPFVVYRLLLGALLFVLVV